MVEPSLLGNLELKVKTFCAMPQVLAFLEDCIVLRMANASLFFEGLPMPRCGSSARRKRRFPESCNRLFTAFGSWAKSDP